jgi:ABC-2 type transport system permease protein
MAPFYLIAEREFRAYVATLSFWVALVVGPLAMAGAMALASVAGHPTAPVSVSIETPNPAVYRSAAAALGEAAQLEGHAIVILPRGAAGAVKLELPPRADGQIDMALEGPLPLSAASRALVQRTLERDAALARLGEATGVAQSPTYGVMERSQPDHPAPDTRVVARFALVMMLWLTLTGSLGMLLQAVVRERATRALESLLAAARPADVVAGKLVGVGAVSLLVLGAWLGAGALLAPLAPQSAGIGQALMAGIGNPIALARAALIYVLAFAFYGLVTVALGAGARDTTQAQNLSRPMFAVLLAAFFAALLAAGGAGGPLAWLIYLPPFTPFMLLLAPPGSVGVVTETVTLLLLAASALLAGRMAIRRLDLTPASPRLSYWGRSRP